MKTFAIALICIMTTPGAFGASLYKQALTTKAGHYIRDGVVVGGTAGTGASLLGVQRGYFPKAHLERIVVDVGDRLGQPSGKNMSYYQVAVDSQHKRVVLDLSQMRMSKVSEPRLRQLFKKSPFVASTALTFDPEDKAATMVLNLKTPMRAEVFEVLKDKKPARVVIDLKPLQVVK